MRFSEFIGPSYASQSPLAADEQTINWYPETVETPGGKSKRALYPCPGFDSFATVGDSPGRGIFAESGRCFAVFGGTFYEVSSAGVPTARGTVAQDTNPVTMATTGDAGDELLITSGGNAYVFDLVTNAFALATTAVTFGDQLDGFFIALDATNSTLKLSDSLDGLTWDPTQVVQRTAGSDPWLAMKALRGELALLGERTSEFWFNAGDAPYPFARRSGSFVEVGIGAAWSVARLGASSLAWLGRTRLGLGKVYMLSGYTPIPISTHAIDWAVQQYIDDGGVTNAVGWSYEAHGHSFYVLEFPTQGRTWVYDSVTNEWHQRGRWSPLDNAFLAYRARFQASVFNRILVCDNQGNAIYALSSTTYTDVGGSELRRLRRGPSLASENRKLVVDYFELEVERGVGLVSGQGSAPQILFRMSHDGGRTWGTPRPRSLGAMGAYRTRVRWDRCGAGRDNRPEISVSDPVPVRLMDAYVGVRGVTA